MQGLKVLTPGQLQTKLEYKKNNQLTDTMASIEQNEQPQCRWVNSVFVLMAKRTEFYTEVDCKAYTYRSVYDTGFSSNQKDIF